jgi:chromosome segregation ATPase
MKCCSPPASLEKQIPKIRPLTGRNVRKVDGLFYPQNQKRRSITMTKPKTLDQLRAEKEQAETQLAQEQHKLERLEDRKRYLEKGERTKRTHRICNLGGTIESLAPEVKDLTRTEMTELMEHLPFLWETRKALSG